jgi:hypothetical protein
MDLNRVPSCPTEIQFLVLIVESHVTRGIETNDAGIDVRAAQCVIDEVVIRRIFIHATAERAIDTRVRVIMPGLSRLKSIEIDLIFARGAVVPCFSRRLLEIAAGSPRFQIRSRIAKLDRPRGRARFWPNQELGELEAGDITDVGVDETDEWRWTFEHLYVPKPSARAWLQWGARTGARARE